MKNESKQEKQKQVGQIKNSKKTEIKLETESKAKVNEKANVKENKKLNQGITLIALVITIVVLIILAGVSINLVLGENGLFNRAKQAVEEYKQAAIDEQKMTNDLEEGIEKIANDNRPKTIEEAKETNYGYFYEKTTLEDSDKNKIVIPEGFKIAEDSGDNVTEGIVIEDKDITTDGDGKQRGNQYVWIPVSNIDNKGSNKIMKKDGTKIEITLGRYEFADGTTVNKDNEGNDLNNGMPLVKGTEILRQTAENYTEKTVIASYYQELATYNAGSATDGQNRTAKDLKGFIDSVEANGGYYIARYEASYGTDNKPNSKVSNNPNGGTDNAPKAEGDLWNNITQIKAAEVCDNMYNTISSDLVNSYAYDTAILYIQKFSEDEDYSRQNSKNHTLDNTGKNGDEVCKINDMASNCYEWTTEKSVGTDNSDASPCVRRGGCYSYSYDFTSRRYFRNVTSSYGDHTFRPILYISSTVS